MDVSAMWDVVFSFVIYCTRNIDSFVIYRTRNIDWKNKSHIAFATTT